MDYCHKDFVGQSPAVRNFVGYKIADMDYYHYYFAHTLVALVDLVDHTLLDYHIDYNYLLDYCIDCNLLVHNFDYNFQEVD